jgi:hypothetical protein
MLARTVRLPFARGVQRLRQLSSAIELKGIGQAADLQDVVVDGVTVIKMEPTGASVGTHANLPSLPPKMHIDWSYLMADLDEDAKKEVLQMKAVVDRQQREIDLKRSELASAGSVDWDKWASELTSPNAKTLLDGFKTEMQAWTFDASGTNKVIDQYRADLKEMVRVLSGAPRALVALCDHGRRGGARDPALAPRSLAWRSCFALPCDLPHYDHLARAGVPRRRGKDQARGRDQGAQGAGGRARGADGER